MQLDGNFYKKEVTELKPEISQRRKNIETYLITRYNMNLSFAQQITSILEKTSLDDKDLRSGMNDSVIELAIKQMTEKRTSSLNDAQHIRKQETAENVISSNSSNQTEDQDSAKKQEFEEMRRKYIEDMEKYQAEKKSLAETVTALEQKAQTVRDDAANADEFIRRLKAYLEVPELTREMCLELIEFITVDECPGKYSKAPREIHIYYKLIDKKSSAEQIAAWGASENEKV